MINQDVRTLWDVDLFGAKKVAEYFGKMNLKSVVHGPCLFTFRRVPRLPRQAVDWLFPSRSYILIHV